MKKLLTSSSYKGLKKSNYIRTQKPAQPKKSKAPKKTTSTAIEQKEKESLPIEKPEIEMTLIECC
jgi:cell division septation protein DedD